ncbi:hypothetical protein EVAR_342_1 [Eumeta japonica]|uniref:Uncharacterized protein n=1 Tax=Eumeta variegata TaxID=151549 RepID=A0A4C1S9M8_EUMVA|nr:hypothetical protein EVAR_342_1 [Eumeta japonica]
MKVKVDKIKVMAFKRDQTTTESLILIEDEKVEQVKEFVHLGSLFTNYDKNYIERKVNAGNKVIEALFVISNSKSVSRQAPKAIHKRVLIPALVYGSESWV